MGLLKLRSRADAVRKEKINKSGPSEPSKKREEHPEELRTLVGKGYARKGDLIAKITHGVASRDGKNLFGEIIPAKKVYEPKLVAGSHVKTEQGTHYYMGCDGLVEVFRDAKGIHYISGRVYRVGSFTISISEDEMEAYLTVIPPMGGAEPVKFEDLLTECKKQGIVFGLNRDAARTAVERAAADKSEEKDVLIARGDVPVDGREGELEFKVQLASGTPFKLLEDGSVDFKEQDRITNVDEGQLVVVVKKAQAGIKDGHTVRGSIVKSKKGKEIEIEVGSNISMEYRGDEIHYCSKIGGQLIFKGKTISVEPLLKIEGDVGPATGNVEFDGNVVVKGNVRDNYRVVAKKSITIDGNVGSCVVKTGENLIVRNGVVGKNKAYLFARGDIRVKFAENANLAAYGSIYIQRAALNCRITAGEKVISKTEKGQIIGGDIRAKKGVEVKILGNESEHKMDVSVGYDFFAVGKLSEIRNTKKKYESEMNKMILILEKLKKIHQTPEELPEKLRKVYIEARKKKTLLGVAIQNLVKKEQETESKLEESWDAEVHVHESLFRGVRIYFGEQFYEPEVTKTKVRIYNDKNYEKIRYEKLILR